MLVIAASGLFVNLFGAWLLHRHQSSNVNMRGALFHLMGDALGSVGVIVAAICVQLWGWTNADPAVSILISVIIVISAMRLIFDTAHLIMDGTPTEIDASEVEKALRQVPMVKDIHDLHIWSITSGMPSLSVHVVCEESKDCYHHDLFVKIKKMLVDKFKIDHVTIQLEDQSLRDSEPEV
jgi:cobalt-zinc-cadmium efflux system protein